MLVLFDRQSFLTGCIAATALVIPPGPGQALVHTLAAVLGVVALHASRPVRDRRCCQGRTERQPTLDPRLCGTTTLLSVVLPNSLALDASGAKVEGSPGVSLIGEPMKRLCRIGLGRESAQCLAREWGTKKTYLGAGT